MEEWRPDIDRKPDSGYQAQSPVTPTTTMTDEEKPDFRFGGKVPWKPVIDFKPESFPVYGRTCEQVSIYEAPFRPKKFSAKFLS
jgi:hypothetical protein